MSNEFARPARPMTASGVVSWATFVILWAVGVTAAHAQFPIQSPVLFVSNPFAGSIDIYDPNGGGLLGTLDNSSSGNFATPGDIAFGPDGNLYVVNSNGTNSSIVSYNPQTGAFLGTFVGSGSGPSALANPTSLAFGSGPTNSFLYVMDSGVLGGSTADDRSAIRVYNASTGAFLGNNITNANNGYTTTIAASPDIAVQFLPTAGGADYRLRVADNGQSVIRGYNPGFRDNTEPGFQGDFVGPNISLGSPIAFANALHEDPTGGNLLYYTGQSSVGTGFPGLYVQTPGGSPQLTVVFQNSTLLNNPYGIEAIIDPLTNLRTFFLINNTVNDTGTIVRAVETSPGVFSLTQIGAFGTSGAFVGILYYDPIPEPTTWALVMVGIAGAFAAGRWRLGRRPVVGGC